jgi:hypothetical protein
MRFNKLMRQYYQKELEKIPAPLPLMPPQRIGFTMKASIFAINWSEGLGWLFMAGSFLHYFLRGRFFEIVNFIPGFSILL